MYSVEGSVGQVFNVSNLSFCAFVQADFVFVVLHFRVILPR